MSVLRADFGGILVSSMVGAGAGAVTVIVAIFPESYIWPAREFRECGAVTLVIYLRKAELEDIMGCYEVIPYVVGLEKAML
jgi:hypothetical protein